MIPFDVDQEGWGAQKVFADGELPGLWVPDKWVIHYGGNASSGATEPYSQTKEMAALRIYEQSHLSRGWRAIGYNYAVGQTGTIYRLRGENMSGATSGDYEPDGIPENSEARAVLWIGGGDQEPSDEAYLAMAKLIQSDLRLVTVHSDHKATGCPGPYWRQWKEDRGWEDDVVEALKNVLHAMVDGAWDSDNPNINPKTPEGRAYWHGRVDVIEDPLAAEEFRWLFKALFDVPRSN